MLIPGARRWLPLICINAWMLVRAYLRPAGGTMWVDGSKFAANEMWFSPFVPPLHAARGIVVGLALSIPLWTLIISLVWWLLR